MTMCNNSAGELRSIIERIESVETQMKEMSEDRKEIYQEAKSNGYDVPALRAVIRLRKQDKDKRAELDAIVESYMHALGELADTPLGRAAIERATAN